MLKVALVGKANVGKSKLFNRLSGSRQALVADAPGVTRDRQYAYADGEDLAGVLLVDTAGWSSATGSLSEAMRNQTLAALEEADLVLFVVDGSELPNADDLDCSDLLRRQGKPCWMLINKIDTSNKSTSSEYAALGWDCLRVSAQRRTGFAPLRARLLEFKQQQALSNSTEVAAITMEQLRAAGSEYESIKAVIVGRPNSGKSTLSNYIVGAERQVVNDSAGTTRDSVCNQLRFRGHGITLIDTPGLRRASAVDNDLEKLSSGKTREAINLADVIVVLLDAQEGVTQQDMRILNQGWERGCALLLVVNKVDLLDSRERNQLQRQIEFRLRFLKSNQVYWISANTGAGVARLMRALPEAFAAVTSRFSTRRLCDILFAATQARVPPMVARKKTKLRFAHMGSDRPPSVIIHGSNTGQLPESYKSYLARYFAENVGLDLPRLKLEFREKANPYT